MNDIAREAERLATEFDLGRVEGEIARLEDEHDFVQNVLARGGPDAYGARDDLERIDRDLADLYDARDDLRVALGIGFDPGEVAEALGRAAAGRLAAGTFSVEAGADSVRFRQGGTMLEIGRDGSVVVYGGGRVDDPRFGADPGATVREDFGGDGLATLAAADRALGGRVGRALRASGEAYDGALADRLAADADADSAGSGAPTGIA